MAISEKQYIDSIAFQIYILDKSDAKAYLELNEEEKKVYYTMAKIALVVSKSLASEEEKREFMKVMFINKCPDKQHLIPQIQEVVELMVNAVEVPVAERVNYFDNIPAFLEQKKAIGENVVYEFNGTLLFSCCDTPDTCYLKYFGETREESLEKLNQETKQRASQKQDVKDNLLVWKEKGKKFIYPEKYVKWDNVVHSYERLNFALIIGNVVEVLETLDRETTIEKTLELINSQGHSGGTEHDLINLVTEFSKRGPEFYRKVMKLRQQPISPEKEKELRNLEQENKQYALMNFQPR